MDIQDLLEERERLEHLKRLIEEKARKVRAAHEAVERDINELFHAA